MPKEIIWGRESRAAFLRGIDQLADAVKITLGPKGRNVIDKKFGSPTITKDGVTVASEIKVNDAFENMGAQMVREVGSRTSNEAGGGTTTATVLAQVIFREGLQAIAAGANPMAVKRGIEKAVERSCEEISRLSTPMIDDDIIHIGTISANGDSSIGEFIAEAMSKVGKDGVISVEESHTIETTLEIVDGMQFDRGYLSPYFITDQERLETILENPLILIYEKKLSATRELHALLEQVSRAGKPILIIAEDLEMDALGTLVVNKLRGTVNVAAVKAPGFGDGRAAMLEDIASVTGGTVIREGIGLKLEDLKLDDLGQAKKVVIDKDNTTIVEGAGGQVRINERMKALRTQMEQTASDYDREKLERRLSKLARGVAVIRVGATTETKLKEKKARVEDAMHATRAAIEEGTVPGGGVALLRAQQGLYNLTLEDNDEVVGVEIVGRALEEPIWQIAQNAGLDGAVVVQRVLTQKNPNFGFNAATEKFEDLVKAGIIDPAKVTRTALQNAASIAGLMLTTEALVPEGVEDEPDIPSPSTGGQGTSEDPEISHSHSGFRYTGGIKTRIDDPVEKAPNGGPKPVFYFLLEGERVEGDVVEYGADVDLVFNYGLLAQTARIILKGTELEHARATGAEFGLSVIPRGFSFRKDDERWYKVGRFHNGELVEPVRFLLKAKEAQESIVDDDELPARKEDEEQTGFYISFHFLGHIQYSFGLPVRLVKSLTEVKVTSSPAHPIEIDLDKQMSAATFAEELLGNPLEMSLL
jgi:chaperonin GroEL